MFLVRVYILVETIEFVSNLPFNWCEPEKVDTSVYGEHWDYESLATATTPAVINVNTIYTP